MILMIMSSSSLVISLSINPQRLTHTTPLSLSHKSSFPSLISTKSKSLISRFSSSASVNPDEFKWLREEQRWLREEQRWLREEQRWIRERDSLLIEIAELKLKIQALEKNRSILISAEETVDSVAGVMKVLKEKNLIAAAPEASEKEEGEVVKVVGERRSKVEEIAKTTTAEKIKRKSLKKGSEGEDVKIMQEALEKLGFYSGEEDTEYSIFLSGTERAVKTWQATIGESEDGIMTSELLEKLYTEQHIEGSGIVVNLEQEVTISQRGGLNGAAIASVTETSEIKQTVVKKDVNKDGASENRVFLLGENRWEDPSRLGGGKKKVVGNKTETSKTQQCTTCRGEGRILCMECDGTGEPNIEEQFMEWVDEGTKCPYCEGLGFTPCDVCQENTMT